MDIKLSKRMQAVANMVQESRVVDIGCDHAFVSIYLARTSNVKKVIAMDVRKGPVDIAKANVALYGLSEQVDVRMSDGFDRLSVGEADVAVIAGMGGYLMIDILKRGKIHLDNGINLILQPQSDVKALRQYLLTCNYKIIMEDMVLEDDKYYTIIKAVPNTTSTISYSDDELTYGPMLLIDKHQVLFKYLKALYTKNTELIHKLQWADSDKSRDRIEEIFGVNQQIQKVMEYYFGESI